MKGVVVKRPLRSFIIPYNRIVLAKRLNWTWKGIRLMASGGLHGFFGLFKLYQIGNIWLYVTNRKKMIYVETDDGTKYAISPENPDEFIKQILNMIRKGK